jgi:thiol-disulfide isomerase/thioredoxin
MPFSMHNPALWRPSLCRTVRRPTLRPALLGLGILALPLLVGCDTGSRDTDPPEDGAARRAAAGQAVDTLPVVQPADAGTILEAVRATDGDVVLLNVWATWCIPCREEFPDLLRIAREYRDAGLRLVLVSADFDAHLDQARTFLADQGVDFPTFQKTGKDMEFIDTIDPEWSGVLPATWLFDTDGTRLDFWTDKASYEALRRRVEAVLAAPAG